ncbi:MAG TPA: hypothetical protein VHA10_12465 [Hypericibacter adhaerens]|uniref:hypothetical protein n=1 Tax=Hypericibacter adhaerens TaxID=2602016 RepID=UPI002D126CE5|nr:hypothetical protein [Hypericibacter adhaerens]HWA44018.1 hypothetical protein [Hypericibacter adhaerens]
MALDPQDLAGRLVSAAAQSAGTSWNTIRQTATIEFQSLAQTIVMIVEARLSGEMTNDMAARHFQTARYHLVAIIAMLTTLVESAIETIVNGALATIRTTVNDAIGFALI